MTTLNIPEIVTIEAEAALKKAAWSITTEVATADHNARAEGDAGAFFVIDPDWRKAQVAKIDALMNAAATLAGIDTREWAEGMISEVMSEIETVHDRLIKAQADLTAAGADRYQDAALEAEAARVNYFSLTRA